MCCPHGATKWSLFLLIQISMWFASHCLMSVKKVTKPRTCYKSGSSLHWHCLPKKRQEQSVISVNPPKQPVWTKPDSSCLNCPTEQMNVWLFPPSASVSSSFCPMGTLAYRTLSLCVHRILLKFNFFIHSLILKSDRPELFVVAITSCCSYHH